jgi:electron transfer flavoprotein alpha subunit
MILVIAEQQEGTLNRVSWEAVAAAQKLPAGARTVIVVPGEKAAGPAGELAEAAVDEVLTLDYPALARYTADGYTSALRHVVEQLDPRYVVLSHTYQTRDFASKLAARLNRAIVTDCIAIKQQGDVTRFTRPMFQGKMHADVVVGGDPPYLVTVQIGAFRADQAARGASAAPVRRFELPEDLGPIRQKPEAPFREARQAVDLSQAERIVAVGRGIKSQENVALAEELARVLGAEVGASRPICDSGWMPMDRQIGSSGQTVAPKLYLALGVSGAIQHVVGIKGARTIVAINKDPEAPIFEVADYGIVGDLFDVIPALIKELKG